jgi:hypothetical protein
MYEKISSLAVCLVLAVGVTMGEARAEPGTDESWEWFTVAQGKGNKLERFGVQRPGEAVLMVADCRERFVSVAADTATLGRLIGSGQVPILRFAFAGSVVDAQAASVHLNEMGPEDWDVRAVLDTDTFTRAAASPDFHLFLVGRTPDRTLVIHQDLGELPEKGRAALFHRLGTDCRVGK